MGGVDERVDSKRMSGEHESLRSEGIQSWSYMLALIEKKRKSLRSEELERVSNQESSQAGEDRKKPTKTKNQNLPNKQTKKQKNVVRIHESQKSACK